MMTVPHATATHRQSTSAPADRVWHLLQDVASWKQWNAGLLDCTIDGPFQVGATLAMTMPDHEVICSQLVEVVPGRRFTDEARLGDIVVRVSHDVTPEASGGCTITYAATVTGEGAEDICGGVSSDFPEVLAALAAAAEASAAGGR